MHDSLYRHTVQCAASPWRRPVSNEVMSVNALLKLEKSMTWSNKFFWGIPTSKKQWSLLMASVLHTYYTSTPHPLLTIHPSVRPSVRLSVHRWCVRRPTGGGSVTLKKMNDGQKWHILFTPEMATLNRKEEHNNYCLHKKPILLDKTWIPGDH